MRGRIDWGVTEVELMGMHYLHAVRANVSSLSLFAKAGVDITIV